MREKECIMMVGTGELGGIVLEFLSRIPGICDIVACDLDEQLGLRKTNSAILGASYAGLYPNIKFLPFNVLDLENCVEILKRINPTIIYNGTTLQPGRLVNELPPEVNARLYKDRCGFGPWTAMHLALTSQLMRAVKLSGIDTHVLNASYPDATHASLAKIGLAPTVGIGNMDLIVPYVKKATSERLHIPMANVELEMIAHHYHCYNWCRNGTGYEAPHYLRIYVGKKDVTEQLGDMKTFVADLPMRAMRPAGRHGQFVVAASSVKNILAILNDTGEITHAPGPQGLEGGFPVRLSRKGAEVVLPENMGIEKARNLMIEAQQYDGIQDIKDNGDIVLTDEAYTNFKETLNVDCKTITIEDSYEQAAELRKKFEEFAKKYGVSIPI